MARLNCWRSSRRQRRIVFRQPRSLVWMFLLANTQPSRPRSEPSRSASMPGTGRVRKAGGSKKSLALVRSSLPPWSPRWAIGRHSHRAAVSLPGSGLFPGSIRLAARRASARFQNRAIDICDGCSCVGKPRTDTGRRWSTAPGHGYRPHPASEPLTSGAALAQAKGYTKQVHVLIPHTAKYPRRFLAL